MSDSQKATVALNLLVESCTAALTGLSEDANDIEDYPTSDFITLRTDFLSILSIIHAATTKVALSLKPSAPHPKASLVPIKDLTNNVAALVHSIRLMRVKEGATVMQEYETVVSGVINAVRSLATTLQSSAASNVTTNEEYLTRTGEVHELIDTVKKTNGLSLNNRDAVHRIFSRNHDSLVDASEEIQEICKPTDEDGPSDDEDAFDDGWEELGILSNAKLSPAELLVAQKVQALVKLTLLLHKKLMKEILSSDSRLKENSSLDAVGSCSKELVAAFDNLISSMYAPQQASNIAPYLESFQCVVDAFQTSITPPQTKTLTKQLEGLSISNQGRDKTDMWYATCFDQIDKASASVKEALQSLEDTTVA